MNTAITTCNIAGCTGPKTIQHLVLKIIMAIKYVFLIPLLAYAWSDNDAKILVVQCIKTVINEEVSPFPLPSSLKIIVFKLYLQTKPYE